MRCGPLFFSTILLCLFGHAMLHAQVALDTLDATFKQQMLQYYQGHTAVSDAFAKQIQQRQIRKSFVKLLERGKANFEEEVAGGKYIYHPKYTPFFESVFDELKHKNPELIPNPFKVVVTSGADAEAFSMENQIIGFDLSLLMHFENQYQVAFTIAHETAHQLLKHSYQSIENYLQSHASDDLEKEIELISKQEYHRIRSLSVVIKRMAYADTERRRKFEQQADSLGILLFRKAYPGYDQEALQTLKILKQIGTPKDSLSESDFKKLFAVGGVTFNSKWIDTQALVKYSYRESESVARVS